MELIRTLSHLVNSLRSSCIRRRVAVVCPNDPHTEYVIIRSLREEIAEYLLVVDAEHKEMAYSLRSASPDFVRVYEADTPDDAAALAVELVRTGEADILMKGLINTDNLLRRVALIHCTEKVNEKFPHTLSYVQLKEEALQGHFGQVFIDGPMDAKTACDRHSGEIKGLSSPVVGNADVLIFPNIEAGNTFYKTLSLFGDANMAGMLTGTIAPVVVPSRSDSGNSKFYSLALACMASNLMQESYEENIGY